MSIAEDEASGGTVSASAPGPQGVPSLGWQSITAIGLATVMASFAGTGSLSTIIPVIAESLSSDLAATSWMLSIYQLVSAGLVLPFGRLGDSWGHARLFRVGALVFTVGSLACGLAPSIALLIGSRLVQGVGAALIWGSTTAILSLAGGRARRGRVIGLQLTLATGAMSLGPLMSGALAQHVDWRWVFLANVPIGILLIWGLRSGPDPRSTGKAAQPFDLIGGLSLVVGLTGLMLVLSNAPAGGLSGLTVAALAAVSCVAFAIFIVQELRVDAPVVDLRLLRDRQLSVGLVAAVANYVGMSGALVLVPVYLITGRGLGPVDAGILLAVMPIVRTVLGPISGLASDAVGTRVLAAVGLLVHAGGLFLLSRLTLDSHVAESLVGLVVLGIGTAMFLAPNTSGIMGLVPSGRQGMASGLVAVSRNVGIAIGVVLAASIASAVDGAQSPDSLVAGVQAAFMVAAGVVGVAGVAALAIRR